MYLFQLYKNIKPYSDFNDLLGFRIDFEHCLTETELIKNIEFEMTGNLECMMLVKCKLKDKNLQPREVAYKIIECWKTELATSDHLYKVEINTQSSSKTNQLQVEKFVLTFVTWHSFFLTGQIIVQQ